MPLFKCPRCGCIENTALGEYQWDEHLKDPEAPITEICSECATGTWHGKFPKETPEQAGMVLLDDGYYGPPGGWK